MIALLLQVDKGCLMRLEMFELGIEYRLSTTAIINNTTRLLIPSSMPT